MQEKHKVCEAQATASTQPKQQRSHTEVQEQRKCTVSPWLADFRVLGFFLASM